MKELLERIPEILKREYKQAEVAACEVWNKLCEHAPTGNFLYKCRRGNWCSLFKFTPKDPPIDDNNGTSFPEQA